MEIHTGDKVPADIRVLQLKTAVLRVEQAALTGESVAVAKTAAPLLGARQDCELQVGGWVWVGGWAGHCCWPPPAALRRLLRHDSIFAPLCLPVF